nr:uncharacterized protein LOC110369613 isoform X2 [Helicoverpa armigera]
MEGEGMVAVVRGLRDAGLAVTVMDGSRQYTLVPNNMTQQVPMQRQQLNNSMNTNTQPCNLKYSADCNTDNGYGNACDRVAQAIDGRYASTYKTTHCRLKPTSPPVQLTEFPPQRADPCPAGHGNFQVGGSGSGAGPGGIHTQTRHVAPTTSFRGAMSWPDRGSVCSPRGSHEVDAFANSLRKYPCLSPDRSSEVMERLINYTQIKGLSKTFARSTTSPTKINEMASHHAMETKGGPKSSRSYEPEVTLRRKVEDPPTKDRKKEKDDHHDFRPLRNFDVRFLREVSRRARDSARLNSSYPYAHPVCPTIKETNGYAGASDGQNNSVNNGIQAAVKMISKEVATVPRDLLKKTVAVPVSPTSSAVEDVMEDDVLTRFKSRTVENTFCKRNGHTTRTLDIHEREKLNKQASVQAACSSIDIKTTRCKYCEITSKSQEEMTRITQKHEVIKRRDMSRGDVGEDASECFEIHSDKVKVKVWGDKLKRLAQKLNRPGGEEKLRNKIEKYLKQVPEQLSDADEERVEFRKQLPNDIIRKLKKLYMNPPETNFNIYRMELYKYCSRNKIENLRKAVFNWTKALNIKKRDYLGRTLKKEDIFKFVADKLEPVVLARPPSDTEYRLTLTSHIGQIVEELPLAINSHSKELLHKITENLVNDILTVETKTHGTYVQPTTKEIKEFVRDEVTFFLQKSRVAVSTKRMEYLEAELIDVLLDIVNIADVDDYVIDNVTTLFKELGKLPEYKAKYFSHLILKDYTEFFFRENFFQFKGHSEEKRPYVTSLLKNVNGMSDLRGLTSFDVYTLRLTEEINKWITNLDIRGNDHNVLETVINDLATEIVERYKYLLLNPRIKGTEAEELEHLKFQIFKWTNKLDGEGNTKALEHAQELLNAINNIPKPSVQSSSAAESVVQETKKQNENKSYIDIIVDEINDWYRELPAKVHMTQDARINTQLIKVLAQEIDNGLSKKEDGIIDREVDKWAEKVFSGKFIHREIEQLKDRINCAIESRENNPRHEKVLIRSYEDIVDEWIDTVPIAPKKEGVFMNNKNELVHEIAVKICKIQTKIDHLPPELIEKKLQEELSHWLKKLPLHVKIDKPTVREKYAEKLVKNIQTYNIHGSTRQIQKITTTPSKVAQLEDVVLVWLRKLPLYRIKTSNEKIHLEAVMKELAHKIDKTIVNGDGDIDDDITEHIRMLDRRKNEKLIQNMSAQLKSHLQKLNLLTDLSQQNKDDFVAGSIDAWVKNLPLQKSESSLLEIKKNDFVKNVRRLVSSSSNNSVLKKEIIFFMKTLPLIRNHKADIRFLNDEADKLIHTLTAVPVEDVSREIQNKTNEITCQAIKKWADTLPLKSVHCPRELRYFIDDMSTVITMLLVDLDHNKSIESDKRLHREIVKFLRRFPLRQEHRTDSHISRMADELIKTLKEVRSFGEKTCTQMNKVTVGVALGNANTTDDVNIESLKDNNDVQNNIDNYTRELVQQISEWFDSLNVPAVHKDGYKEVIMNDLAGDIIDRHKYIELNPYTTLSDDNELEHLKYQIFKWINKLVGEDNLETIAHAEDLLQRVNKISVPMLVRPQDRKQSKGNLIEEQSISQTPNESADSTKHDSNSGPTNTPSSGGRFSGSSQSQQASARAGSNLTDIIHINQPSSQDSPPSSQVLPEGTADEGTKEAVYEKYQKIFRTKCDALPIDSSTPESAKLAELAKSAIYNGIVKTFFNLKSDPDIENDYGYFEFMLEEKIEELLDVLPQSDELVKKRHAWKLDILSNAIDMLDDLHSLSDRPSFRQRVKNKFNRKFAKDLELEQCFLLQQGFIAELADAYILATNYKEKDPVRAKAYRSRLMKRVDDLATHLAKEHNVGFRFFEKEQLGRIAMKVLEQVPIPEEDILQEEAEAIQLADVVERWYNELPTKPTINDTDGVLRKRMIDLLAKKLYDLHKRLKDQDPSKEGKMKHEMSQFLEKRGQLQENQDLNINLMVDELHLRLKTKWLKEPIDYEEFERYKPLSSTFAQVNNAELSSPLSDAATCTRPNLSIPRPVTGLGPSFVVPPIHTSTPIPTLQRTSLYAEESGLKTMRPSLPSPLLKGEAQTFAESISMGNQMTNTPYISQVEARGGISQVGPSEGYISQQYTSMQGPTPSRIINGALEGSQFGPQPGPSPMRSNTGCPLGPIGASGQIFVPDDNAMLQNMESAPSNGVLPEQRFDQSMPNQAQGPYGSNQLFVPGCQGSRGSTPTDYPGYQAGRGPTPCHGTASAVPIGPGVSVDMYDSAYQVKCRCFESYRRRRRFFDQDGRYKPYDCNF